MDVHAIQTVPPSNINRDDTGSLKLHNTAEQDGQVQFSVMEKGYQRLFSKRCEQSKVGIRTLKIVEYIANEILD